MARFDRSKVTRFDDANRSHAPILGRLDLWSFAHSRCSLGCWSVRGCRLLDAACLATYSLVARMLARVDAFGHFEARFGIGTPTAQE